ncbi:MAG: cupin domain-containing protein [candidate division WOR-3 bacterium]|nr:MAG: cupin domain-containing protein [candidate division WOR-3 bacterium]
MFVIRLQECSCLTAGDGSLLREILHPSKHAVDIRYSLAWAKVEPKQKTLAHTLLHAEVYYILKGEGDMHIDKEVKLVAKNDTIYIPPGAVQFIKNTGEDNLEFLCIVDPAWQAEIERPAEDI